MTLKLSHSSASRYMKCGESYRLHYIEKLRPTVSSSALLFGSALDAAIGSLLSKKEADPYDLFLKNWEQGWVNKKLINLPMSTDIVYAAADFDKALLTEIDFLKLTSAIKDLGLEYVGTDPLDVYAKVADFKKQASYRQFRENEFKYLNYTNWLCLARKGKYLIDAFVNKVMPLIKEVHAVQKEIELEDDKGNKVTGFIDFIATLEDGKKYVLDLKTAARPYEDDAVQSSAQLTLYAHHEGIEDAGFVVLSKAIKKNKNRKCHKCGTTELNNRVKTCSQTLNGTRCGGEFEEVTTLEGDVQIILGKVNPRMEEMILGNLNNIAHLIESGIFLKNPDSCASWYGGDCPYKQLCLGGCTDNLVVQD